jgi:ATP-dependent Lon protease
MGQLNHDLLRQLHQLSLTGVAFTAEVQPDGQLTPIGGVLPKLIAAAREKLYAIHTVVVAKAQRKDVDPALLEENPHAGFRVICADTVAEVVHLMEGKT